MLSECWHTLAIAGLSNKQSIKFCNRIIPTKLIRFAIASSVATITTLEAIICVKNYGNGFQALLHPIHLVIALFAMLMIYISLLVKIKEISQLIHYLEQVVEEREFFFRRFLLEFFGSFFCFDFFVCKVFWCHRNVWGRGVFLNISFNFWNFFLILGASLGFSIFTWFLVTSRLFVFFVNFPPFFVFFSNLPIVRVFKYPRLFVFS